MRRFDLKGGKVSWISNLLIAYASLLLVAGVWAIVERTLSFRRRLISKRGTSLRPRRKVRLQLGEIGGKPRSG